MCRDYSYSPVPGVEGEIVGVLDVALDGALDVTETVRGLEQRRTLAEQLRQVLAATTDSVMGVDRDWVIPYSNLRAETLHRQIGPLVAADDGGGIFRNVAGRIAVTRALPGCHGSCGHE